MYFELLGSGSRVTSLGPTPVPTGKVSNGFNGNWLGPLKNSLSLGTFTTSFYAL